MVLSGPLLSLLLLFSIFLLVSLVEDSQANYQRFLQQHVDPKRFRGNPHSYCHNKLRALGLTSPTCPKRHIFIHARISRVKIICGPGGIINGTLSQSRLSYSLTTCYSKGGSPPNYCRYRGRNERRKVRLNCSEGLPVHLIGAVRP